MSKQQPKDVLCFTQMENDFCCGINHIGNLECIDGYWIDEDGYDISMDEYAHLSNYEKQQYKASEDVGDTLPSRVAVMATTIANMKKEIVLLKQLKFKAMWSFVNPNTGNKITVWFRKPTR